MNIKIYVACHKDCYVPKISFIYPIQVGSSISKAQIPNFLRDDAGIDNISNKNKLYCELTAQYWAWKNDNESDYYGLWHYRRYMSFCERFLECDNFGNILVEYLNDKVIEDLCINEESMTSLIQQYDVIVPCGINNKNFNRSLKSNYQQYSLSPNHYSKDLDTVLEVIKDLYPDFYELAKWYLFKCNIGYYCNMFIMKKDIFRDYSKWLFSILSEFENRTDLENYNSSTYRVCGYLGERLLGIYYYYLKDSKKYKCCELQKVFFYHTEKKSEVKPFLSQDSIPIGMCFNNDFVPYSSVTIKSLILNSKDENNYDLLIISSDISTENKKILTSLIKDKKNFSMRFIDPNPILKNFKPYLYSHFGQISTYYRIFLPELLNNYHKVIYLDSDMIIKTDVAELFNIDLEGYLLAACYDADTSGLYNGFQENRKEYTDHVLKLSNPYEYFQAGVIVFNLDLFREKYTLKEKLTLSTKEEWLLQDQDVLNILCQGRVKYLDMSWNCLVDFIGIRRNQIIALAPFWQQDMYEQARTNPKIIHYAGPEKPYFVPEMDFGLEFWKYAKLSPYYEVIIKRMIIFNTNETLNNKPVRFKLIKKLLLSFKSNGFFCTLGKAFRYVGRVITRRNKINNEPKFLTL